MVKEIFGSLLNREPESTSSAPLLERLIVATDNLKREDLRLQSLSQQFSDQALVVSPAEYARLEAAIHQQAQIVQRCKQQKDELENEFGIQEFERNRAEEAAAREQEKAELAAQITLTSAKIEQLQKSIIDIGIQIQRERVKFNQLLQDRARIA